MPATTLERQFEQAMLTINHRAKDELGYVASTFLNMLCDKGGVLTANFLVNGSKPSDGYTVLYERKRLDLTREAVVIEQPEWHELFTPTNLQNVVNGSVILTTRLNIVSYRDRWPCVCYLIPACSSPGPSTPRHERAADTILSMARWFRARLAGTVTTGQ